LDIGEVVHGDGCSVANWVFSVGSRPSRSTWTSIDVKGLEALLDVKGLEALGSIVEKRLN
jgi:hypothetical protein